MKGKVNFIYNRPCNPRRGSIGSGVPKRGFKPPSRNSIGLPNSFKLNPYVKKFLEMAEFRTPTPQDVRKKKAVKF